MDDFAEKLAGYRMKTLMLKHYCSQLGMTKAHLKHEGKIRVDYFAINAPRPPPERGLNSGGVSLLFRKTGGVKLIYKHAEKNFPMVIAQVGKVKCGVIHVLKRKNV